MHKITIEMPEVARCEVSECAYNLGKACHAKAITVGYGETPGCDTYMRSGQHVSNTTDLVAGVGACKVSGCRYNRDLECTADQITVGYVGSEIRCLTYSPR